MEYKQQQLLKTVSLINHNFLFGLLALAADEVADGDAVLDGHIGAVTSVGEQQH